MIREPFRGTWRPISLDRMQSGAFYDSTRWRCAKGLPPRDKCCHPFRSQLTRAPPFTRSHYRRKTDEWIGAWIIFHFEILAVLRRIRLLREPDRFLLPFYSHGDRCDPSYRYCFDSHHGEYLSLSLYGWFPFRWTRSKKELWNGNRRWDYRRIDRSFGSSNCAMNTTYIGRVEFLRNETM